MFHNLGLEYGFILFINMRAEKPTFRGGFLCCSQQGFVLTNLIHHHCDLGAVNRRTTR
jgi:hypothetical protein